MAEKISAIVQFKRMTAQEWQRSDYVPKESELVFESDTGFAKFGDGRSRFRDLKYLTGPKGDRGEALRYADLTQTQKNELKGENGHSLSIGVRIEGSYRNGQTSQLNIITDVYYDGERLTSGYTVDYYWRGFGTANWQAVPNQRPDQNGKVAQWNAGARNGTPLEVYCVANYQGLKSTGTARIDNVSDGAAGIPGPNGADGAPGAKGDPGENIVNQNGNQPLKYWAGTEAEYNRIARKDANTIYDIYK